MTQAPNFLKPLLTVVVFRGFLVKCNSFLLLSAKIFIMNNSLKTDLESTVKDFEYSLSQIKRITFNNDQIFANSCQDLLDLYRGKLLNSVKLFSAISLSQSNPESFLEDYYLSLKYHSECQRLLERYVEKML